jgi:hypothetical protein
MAATMRSQRGMFRDAGIEAIEQGRGCRGAYRMRVLEVKVLCEASRWWVLK